MMGLRKRQTQLPSVQSKQKRAVPVSLPLGTAAWHQFPDGVVPRFEKGDILIGHMPDDRTVGVKDGGHICVAAQTRSGKGTGLIVPNLIAWPGSVVVIDPKGENAILTARRRGSGSRYARGRKQKVYILDPFHEVSTHEDSFNDLRASFNPLDMLAYYKAESIDDAARIADSIIDSDVSVSDPFWNEAARDLIKAVILHVVSCPEFEVYERNLLKVRDLILEGYAELRALLLENSEDNKAPSAFALLFRAMTKNKAFHGEVSKAGARFARMESSAARMLESIAQVACTNMDFLSSAPMQEMLRHSSFDLAELKTNPRGISIYLCLPQRFMTSHYRFLRMMITLILSGMEQNRSQPKCGHAVLMVLDEFASLKRMRIIENAAAQIAGYGVKIMFVVQNLGQLKEQYKENWQTLVGNCTTKIFFGNDDPFTREIVSKMIGDTEVIRQTNNHGSSKGTSSSGTIGMVHWR